MNKYQQAVIDAAKQLVEAWESEDTLTIDMASEELAAAVDALDVAPCDHAGTKVYASRIIYGNPDDYPAPWICDKCGIQGVDPPRRSRVGYHLINEIERIAYVDPYEETRRRFVKAGDDMPSE